MRAIARLTGYSRAAIRRVLQQPVPQRYRPRPPKPKLLDPYVPYLQATVAARPWVRATIVYEELRRQGYPGHYESGKVWLRTARAAAPRSAARLCPL